MYGIKNAKSGIEEMQIHYSKVLTHAQCEKKK